LFHQASDTEELSQIFSNNDQQNFSMSRPIDHLWIELVGSTEELWKMEALLAICNSRSGVDEPFPICSKSREQFLPDPNRGALLPRCYRRASAPFVSSKKSQNGSGKYSLKGGAQDGQ
jgi:hypothetical protein